MERSLTIPSDPAAIDQVEAFLANLAAELELSDAHTGDLIIAGTEAANNAILHGNRSQPGLRVRLEARLETNNGLRRLRLAVCDQGPLDWHLPLDDPTSTEHLWDISGRGLLIIRHLMDEVRIEPSPRGTCIVMLKALA
jgi:serine/threonine-protein kinase RsbW